MNRGCWKTDDHDKGRLCKGDRRHTISGREWVDLYNQRDTSGKAVYIDLEDEDDEDDENHVYSKWSDLPDLLLEKIFSYLSIREKYYASLVCRSWHEAFYLPYVWSQFVLEDSTLTRGRFNYYSGWQYVLDHLRTQMCLTQVGKNFRHLTFEPMLNFYNLYEFMNMVSWYTEQARQSQNTDDGIGCKIRTLKFTFPCNMSNNEDDERIRLFGTGGKLLAALKRLMANLLKMKRLELIDLMLEPREAQHLLDEVCDLLNTQLRTLILINTTRVQYQLLHVGVFLNLQVLVISPQNIGEESVELLGYTKLKHLHIVQNRYSPQDLKNNPVSQKTWKMCRKNNPWLNVHLELESVKEKELIWHEYAPVRSIIYDSPRIGVKNEDVITTVDMYRNDLRVYGHKNLPKIFRSKSFDERADSSLVLLCRECPYLKVLIITERISTATILLIASLSKQLRYLYVRGNAIIKRCDWPHNPEWSPEYYQWMKTNSQSFESVEKEVSQMLGYKWQFMSDKEFKRLDVNLHEDY